MCGRFTQHSDISMYMQEMEPSWQPYQELAPATPTWNLAPSQDAWVIVGQDGRLAPVRMNWGFKPAWAKPSMSVQINARVETAVEKPYFRKAWRSCRCVVPTDGYYEWQAQAGSGKQPFYISLVDDQPMLMAGLYTDSGFAVITRPAGGALAEVHDRMPLVLPPEQANIWVGAGSADVIERVLDSEFDLGMFCARVSDRVNDPRNNDMKLIFQIADQHPLVISISRPTKT